MYCDLTVIIHINWLYTRLIVCFFKRKPTYLFNIFLSVKGNWLSNHLTLEALNYQLKKINFPPLLCLATASA